MQGWQVSLASTRSYLHRGQFVLLPMLDHTTLSEANSILSVICFPLDFSLVQDTQLSRTSPLLLLPLSLINLGLDQAMYRSGSPATMASSCTLEQGGVASVVVVSTRLRIF